MDEARRTGGMMENQIEKILREHIFLKMPRGGKTNASVHGYLAAAHIIAEGMREQVIYEEKAVCKFISTPSLACNWLRLGGGLFDAVKIPVDAVTGTLLDGKVVRAVIFREG